jgi:hypothetical protein
MGLVLVASPVPKKRSDKKIPGEVIFDRRVLVSTGGYFHLPFDSRTCIDPVGLILEDESFQGLMRVRGPAEFTWRYLKNGGIVERFPNSLRVEIRAVPSYCDRRPLLPPWPMWSEKLVDFMGALRFKLEWMEGSKVIPAEIDSVRASSSSAEGITWPRWTYYLETWSVNVPITDDLSVELLSPEGQRLVRVIGGMDRAEPIG